MAEKSSYILNVGLDSLLLQHGLTQAELADRLGVRQGTVSKWLSGELPILDKWKRKIAKKLNCPLFAYLPDGTHSTERSLTFVDWNNPTEYICVNHAAQEYMSKDECIWQYLGRMLSLRCVPDRASEAHRQSLIGAIRELEAPSCLNQAIESIRRAHRERFHDWTKAPRLICFWKVENFREAFLKRGVYEHWSMQDLCYQLEELDQIVQSQNACFVLIPEDKYQQWSWTTGFETVAALNGLIILWSGLGLQFGFSNELFRKYEENFRACVDREQSEYIRLTNKMLRKARRLGDDLFKFEKDKGEGTPQREWEHAVESRVLSLFQ